LHFILNLESTLQLDLVVCGIDRSKLIGGEENEFFRHAAADQAVGVVLTYQHAIGVFYFVFVRIIGDAKHDIGIGGVGREMTGADAAEFIWRKSEYFRHTLKKRCFGRMQNAVGLRDLEQAVKDILQQRRIVREQARDLSIALLERWLVQYKFKDWLTHRTTNPGAPVTLEEKRARANEIAKLLSNNAHWHSHGRMIGMNTLRKTCKLNIDDFGGDPELQKAVRTYNDALSEYLARAQIRNFLYNRHLN